MSTQSNKTSLNLGQYLKSVFDLNKDGRVSFKEFLTTLIPSRAVGLAFLTVDILAAVGEYRVWQVGMHITNGDPYAAAGFVAVSIVPFYLAQVLWLYPLATGFQQFIAVVMGLTALITSAQFGFADLSQQYNAVVISKWVTRLWLGYIVALLLYVVNDRAFKLMRARIQARTNARYQQDLNTAADEVLDVLERSLQRQKELRDRYGDEAVEDGLLLLQGMTGKEKKEPDHRPTPSATKSLPQPKQYPTWELGPFLNQLGLTNQQALDIADRCQNADQFYSALRSYGVERVDISRKNFGRLYGQLRQQLNHRTPNPT